MRSLKSWDVFWFVFIIFFFTSLPGVSADNHNLTESRNSFLNKNWYQSNDSIIHNNTAGFYMLDPDIPINTYENFTEYTELDTFNKLTVNDTSVSFSNILPTSYDARVYMNKSAPALYNFTYYLRIRITDFTYGTGFNKIALIDCQNENDDFGDNNLRFGLVVRQFNANAYQIRLNGRESGSNINSDSDPMEKDRYYYLKFNRSDQVVGCAVYRYSNFTTIISYMEINLEANHETKYLMVANALGFGSGTGDVSGSVSFLSSPGSMGAVNGSLFFKNLLENTSKKAIWYNTNQTLNGGVLQVLFSEDNITWPYNYTLIETNQAIFLDPYNLTDLYVKYYFEYGYGSPTLNNASIFYDAPTGSGSIVYKYGLGIILLILGLLLGVGVKGYD